jgi:hypothetical protein
MAEGSRDSDMWDPTTDAQWRRESWSVFGGSRPSPSLFFEFLLLLGCLCYVSCTLVEKGFGLPFTIAVIKGFSKKSGFQAALMSTWGVVHIGIVWWIWPNFA